MEFQRRPLAVFALGGNAISPPDAPADYSAERRTIAGCARQLAALAGNALRLVVVHGNGPQVGRLLAEDADANLDIHVAQTQGEIGYLLAQAFRARGADAVCLVTRSLVRDTDAPPEKPVGPIVAERPAGPARRFGDGWRRLVPSPEPHAIVELDAIGQLAQRRHVIAGGGGGVPLDGEGRPVECVIDKDWIAAMLAVSLDAAHLVFVTNTASVRDADGAPLEHLSACHALELVDSGAAAAGSMGPKVASAARYARCTGRTANIGGCQDIAALLAGRTGTSVRPR